MYKQCSNCKQSVDITQAITVYAESESIATLCRQCQQAQKIQITLKKDEHKGKWVFDQYFPMEV